LNKLAKAGSIRRIHETRVYPSARISTRVPFGTGAAVAKMLSGASSDLCFYDPRIFMILKDWIALMMLSFHLSENQILSQAREIDPGLADFLAARGFLSVWPKIRGNLNDQRRLKGSFMPGLTVLKH